MYVAVQLFWMLLVEQFIILEMFINMPDLRMFQKTLFIITTDGMENASRRYSYDKVKHMVERQKKQFGWEFLFLGANIDAVEVAGRFGIGKERAVNYKCDSVGTQA